MERLLQLEQRLMDWLAADYQRRILRATVYCAFRTFAAAEPSAAASLFDEHFVRIHLLPRLYEAAQTGRPITPDAVAELWARQFSIVPATRRHRIAAIRPAATHFLRILAQELARRCGTPVRLPLIAQAAT